MDSMDHVDSLDSMSSMGSASILPLLPVRTLTWLPLAAGLMLAVPILLPAAAAAPSGCLPPWVLQRPDIPPGLPVDPPIDTSEACPAWRWVALKRSPEAPCPAVGFASGVVPGQGPLFEAGDAAGLPPALRSFCVYQVKTGGGAAERETLEQARVALAASLERLVRQGELRKVESGCAAVGPSAAVVVDGAVWPPLRDHFLAQAGRPPVMDAVAALAAPPRVRLALLDTQPDGDGARPGRSAHGYTLGRMARRLVCGGAAGGRCAARVTQRLALPISDFSWNDPAATTFDWERGGFFGTIDQLAQGVWSELEAWRNEGEQEHLVLNLSVAWVGERFGGLERPVGRMPVPVQALYRALQVASCRGALVVAAAGNRIGGPEVETGPLLPGGWERRRAPTRAECQALLGAARFGEAAPEPPRQSSRAEPLVYAAAGIGTDGAPLVNARPASEPPRVAYADHAVVAPGEGDPPPAILTGSSVATTVVSAAAAVVWHHRPELRRAEVMELLQRSGEPLGRAADVHLGPPAPEVRRLAVCPALALACAAGAGECPETGAVSCPSPSRQAPELSRLRLGCTVADLADAARVDATSLTGSAEGNGFCAARTLRFAGDAGPPVNPCPGRQLFAVRARPWTGPQPQNDPCSGCDIRPAPPPPDDGSGLVGTAETDPGYMLRIDIDPDWKGGPLEAALLHLGDIGFALGLPPLEAGACAVVEGLGPELLAPDATGRRPPAVLYFRTAYGSVESPLVVGR